MAQLFVDGFDHYSTADFASKGWFNQGGANTISPAAGRRGGGALSGHASGVATKTLPGNYQSLVVGAAFAFASYANNYFLILRDGATDHVRLFLNASGTISVQRGSTTLATSTQILGLGAWNYIELKATIDDAAGAYELRVNGATWLAASGVDTRNAANAYVNALVLYPALAANYADDLYICDTSGATNNNFLGDCRVDTRLADADGTYSQFTPSTGTTHYALVDEAAPNITDYNDGANVGDRDSYGFAALPALTSQVVYGVQVNALTWKDDAGARSAGTMVRSGTTNADGASVALGTTPVYLSQVYETNPNGGGAWTESAINAAEFGVKVTA